MYIKIQDMPDPTMEYCMFFLLGGKKRFVLRGLKIISISKSLDDECIVINFQGSECRLDLGVSSSENREIVKRINSYIEVDNYFCQTE